MDKLGSPSHSPFKGIGALWKQTGGARAQAGKVQAEPETPCTRKPCAQRTMGNVKDVEKSA